MKTTSEEKAKVLKDNGSFNRHASSVISPLFMNSPYFDARDLVQVKYEMLRAVKYDDISITEASHQFGFSRAAFYKIERRFFESGVDGLGLQKTGPKLPAKTTDDILDFASALKAERPDITNDEIVQEIHSQKGVLLHKRSLQRGRAKKKHTET